MEGKTKETLDTMVCLLGISVVPRLVVWGSLGGTYHGRLLLTKYYSEGMIVH